MKRTILAILLATALSGCATAPPARAPLIDTLRAQRHLADAQLLKDVLDARPGSQVPIRVLPNLVYTAVTESVKRRGNATVWRGRIDSAKYWGAATLVLHEGKLTGMVQVDDRYFSIREGDDESTVDRIENFIAEVSEELFPEEAEPRGGQALLPVAKQAGLPLASADAPITLSVLIVIPPQLAEWCDPSKMQQMEAMSEASLDGVWAQFTDGAVVARVSAWCTTHEAVGGNLLDDLNWVTSDPDVQAQRVATKSNMVAFLVPSAKNCGISNANYPVDDPGAASRAFSVVRFDCAWENYSLAHELGHQLGMDHDRYTIKGGYYDRCNYGYSILQDGKPVARDVLAYKNYCESLGLECPRIGTYSKSATAKGYQFGVSCSVNGDLSPTTGAASNVDQLLLAAPIAVQWQ